MESVRHAVEAVDDGNALREAWRLMTGGVLGEGNAEEALHIEMARDELLYQAARILERPRSLADLVSELAERVGRQVSETELILWLTLGAAARVEAL